MALPALNVSLLQLHVADATPAPTSMVPRQASDSGSEDEPTNYLQQETPSRAQKPLLPTSFEYEPVPSLPQLDEVAKDGVMARRMMLPPGKYRLGRGDMGYWRLELAWTEVDKVRKWRKEQTIGKLMVAPATRQEKDAKLMPFQGPLQRAVHDLREMCNLESFQDFVNDPNEMLKGNDTVAATSTANEYNRAFLKKPEWLGAILGEAVEDLYHGGELQPMSPNEGVERTEGDVRHFLTFHRMTVRIYAVFANAMLFHEDHVPMHKNAFDAAMKAAYRFTQYHIDEWEMSLAMRIKEIDVHVLGSRKPILARYRIPKAVRVLLFVTEMRACPFTEFFQTRDGHLPPPGTKGVINVVRAEMEALGMVFQPDTADFMTLDRIEEKANNYKYGYVDPWRELKKDVALCFSAARTWFRSQDAKNLWKNKPVRKIHWPRWPSFATRSSCLGGSPRTARSPSVP